MGGGVEVEAGGAMLVVVVPKLPAATTTTHSPPISGQFLVVIFLESDVDSVTIMDQFVADD
jgi:hypothetical protein